jgi:Zn-finger nucleic acid-binding protein
MDVKDYDRYEVRYCTGCRGLWFHPDELEDILFDGMRAVFALETGDRSTGKRFDHVDSPPCPECGTGMVQERDAQQPHILLDHCPEGHGVFLDAGEFSDLSKKTLWDRFKLKR